MRLDANRLAASSGLTAAILWILCSSVVAVLPGPMMRMTGHMVHASLEELDWTLTFTGFFVGLIAWMIFAAVTGWLIGWMYSYLGRNEVTQ